MDARTRRKKLIEQIVDWNASRLDLFELSIPDENGEFNGVMRFFFQDASRRYHSKCIRVSSTQKTSDLVDILREKFFPLETNVKTKRFGIYEHCANGVRRLTNDEYPLVVQLGWSKHDREGKFVLKLESSSDDGSQLENGSVRTHSMMVNTSYASGHTNIGNGRLRRGWSFKRDKHASPSSRRGPLGCAAAVGWSKEKPCSRSRGSLPESSLNCLVRHQTSGPSAKHSLLSSDSPLPDSTFTRTIHNPEQLMQRKRQQTLEAKLLQLLQHGEPDLGGTLKIYGGQICPQVPYRTLLLSVNDTVSTVIRQSLDKYGLEDADPDTYCLLMRVRSATDTANGLRGTEEILADTDCPLGLLFASAHEVGSVVTFELRLRPPHLVQNRRTSESSCGTPYWNEPSSTRGSADSNRKFSRSNRSTVELDTAFACLIELNPSGTDDPIRSDVLSSSFTGTVYPLPVHKGHVCIGTAPTPDATHPYVVTLPLAQWPGVELRHLVIWRPPVPHGVTSAMAAAEATQRRGGWLACRPCVRPSTTSGQSKQFASVYVNNHLLTPSPENQGCVYWLSPGDVIRLGNGRRCLKIWPGNGSVMPRFQSKSAFCTASLPSPLLLPMGLRTPLICPEVPKHQRSYSSTLGTPPSSITSSATPPVQSTRPTHPAAVSYLSPLIQCSSPRISGSAYPYQRHTFMDSPSETANAPTPFDSISASSSSLSSNPIAENQSVDGASWFPRPANLSGNYPNTDAAALATPAHRVGEVDASMSRSWGNHWLPNPCTRITLSTGFGSTATAHESSSGATVSVHCQRVPAFCPIPTVTQTQPCFSSSPDNPMQNNSNSVPNRDSLSSELLASTVSPSSQPSSTRSPSQRSGKSSRSKSSTISDRLPCQLAFSPNSVGQFLDWLIIYSLDASCVRQPDPTGTVQATIVRCPLGPAISVYLMLRAIYRQCDRWELIELREAMKESGKPNQSPASTSDTPTIPTRPTIHQRRRRQRELLNLLASSVERLQHFETVLLDSIKPMQSSSTTVDEDKSPWKSRFHHVLCSTAAWLANASQLLHLITRDVNLAKTFELDSNNYPMSEEESTTYSAWNLVQDQLTDVVQAAFGFLTEICVSRLDRISIPQLLSELNQIVDQIRATINEKRLQSGETDEDEDDWASDDLINGILDGEADAVLQMLTETLNSLHAAHVNPAFVVQLFARLLHRLNARLFNFLLGLDRDSEEISKDLLENQQKSSTPEPGYSTHISPIWGRVLHRWIREGLCTWAITEGLGVAAECYLQRVSQAAELMLADMSSVEGIYNIAVDLVGLNSRQVRALLQGYTDDDMHHRNTESSDHQSNGDFLENGRIPAHWIDFVVSGVKLVADRILAEEETAQPLDTSTEEQKGWAPRLCEPLDLLLPLLLPEDSYPSDNPVPGDLNEEPVSCDSGICSRPNSAREQRDTNENSSEDKRSGDPLITVESVRQFLTPAISNGWCRLSVRPIFDAQSNSGISHLLCWNVYLQDVRSLNGNTDAPPVNEQTVPAIHIEQDGEASRPELQSLDQPTDRSSKPQSPASNLAFETQEKDRETDVQLPTSESFRNYTDSLCENHRPVTVVVPKIGQSLGLSIVAAKSEDGRDLGIYVRAIVSGSGASQARVIQEFSEPQVEPLIANELPVLRANDHLLAVNNQSVLGLSQEAAAQLVASAGQEVTLTVVHSFVDRQPALVEQPSGEDNQYLVSRCPECQLRTSFRIHSVEDGGTGETRTKPPEPLPMNDTLDSGLGVEPPPIPSALGPVMHLPYTTSVMPSDWCQPEMSNWSSLQEPNVVSKSVANGLHSPEPILPAQRHHTVPHSGCISIHSGTSLASSDLGGRNLERSSEKFSSVHRGNSAIAHNGHHTPGSNTRDIYETATSEYSLSATREPSELSFNSRTSSRVQDWRNIDSSNPCHRPKGQSASFDEWVTASRLREFCEQFTNELESQLNESELILASDQLSDNLADRLARQKDSTSMGHTPTDIYSDPSRPSLPSDINSRCNWRSRASKSETNSLSRRAHTIPTSESTGMSQGSKPPRDFVPTVSVLPSNGNRPAETPKPKQRTNNHSPNVWTSKSLGDLASLERLLSPTEHQPVERNPLTRTSTLQRRHTTLTTTRLNLGPRPEPPNHGAFYHAVQS